ncbi:unnamed protein product, partial [Polarella glacialis]
MSCDGRRMGSCFPLERAVPLSVSVKNTFLDFTDAGTGNQLLPRSASAGALHDRRAVGMYAGELFQWQPREAKGEEMMDLPWRRVVGPPGTVDPQKPLLSSDKTPRKTAEEAEKENFWARRGASASAGGDRCFPASGEVGPSLTYLSPRTDQSDQEEELELSRQLRGVASDAFGRSPKRHLPGGGGGVRLAGR